MINTGIRGFNSSTLSDILDPRKSKWFINGTQVDVLKDWGTTPMEMMSQPQFIDEADVFSIGSFQNIICLEVKVRIQDTTKEIFWNILRSELNETYTLEYEHPALPERLKYENMGLMFGRLGWEQVETKEESYYKLSLRFIPMQTDNFELAKQE